MYRTLDPSVTPSTTFLPALRWISFVCLIVVCTSSHLFSQGLVARAPSATSVTLTWTAPGDDGNTGTASQYDIRYHTAPITDLNWDACTQVLGEPSPQPAGSTEVFIVDGLNPSTTYYFAIKAADEVPNWSALSNVAQATTVDNVPPAAITNLSVESP